MRNINKHVVLQEEEADCGVACLLSVIKYYGGYKTIESLRRESGTNSSGTTLLGLYQCATGIGFNAKAGSADIEYLKSLNKPIIIHVIDNGRLHYMVVFEYDFRKKMFRLSDPSMGSITLTDSELMKIWTKACLSLEPTDSFRNIDSKRQSTSFLFLLRIIKQDYSFIILSLVLGVFISILGLSTSIFSQKLIDTILPSRNTEQFLIGFITLFLILMVRIIISYIRESLLNVQNQNFNNNLINPFLVKLLNLPKLFFANRRIGDIVARLNDINKIQQVLAIYITNYSIDILTIIISVFFIISVSPKLGIIIILFIPIIIYLIARRCKDIIMNQRDVAQGYSLLESNYISIFRGINDIKSNRKEDYFMADIMSHFENLQSRKFSLRKLVINLNLRVSIVVLFLLIVAMFIASYEALLGVITMGDMVALVGVVGIIVTSLTSIAMMYIPYYEAKIAFDRLYNIVFDRADEENLADKVEIKSIESIEIHNLSFSYAGSFPLYTNSNLKLESGDCCIISGNNGCGKSSLIDLLIGNLQPQKGRVLYNRIDLNTINRNSLISRIAIVPQDVYLFNKSLLWNMTLSDTPDLERLEIIKNKYELESFFEIFPINIHQSLGDGAITLSGGQKQIIGIIRALYNNPQLLVLDEPTASLDSSSSKIIYNIVDKVNSDNEITIVIITHNLEYFKDLSNKICLIKDKSFFNMN